jgi:hypothetical protein
VASPPPEAASDEATAERGGGSEVAAPAPAAPVPGSASALAATSLQVKHWTETEDAQLIGMIVGDVVGHGIPMATAIRTAARWLDRPEQGTAFRCKNKLKARLGTALAAARAAKAEAEALLAPIPDCADPVEPLADLEQAGDATVGGHSPAAVQDEPDMEPGQRQAETAVRAAASIEGQLAEAIDHIATPIVAHIMALTTKGGWTLERDLKLMHLSIESWQPNEIALELKIQASEIRPRFDLLTGLVEDKATGKKVRCFKRKDVLEALKSLTPGKAA